MAANKKWKSKTELRHSISWYVVHYGFNRNLVQRNRKLLDHPATLQLKLLNQRGPMVNLSKFCGYWSSRPNSEFIK